MCYEYGERDEPCRLSEVKARDVEYCRIYPSSWVTYFSWPSGMGRWLRVYYNPLLGWESQWWKEQGVVRDRKGGRCVLGGRVVPVIDFNSVTDGVTIRNQNFTTHSIIMFNNITPWDIICNTGIKTLYLKICSKKFNIILILKKV